MTEPVRGGAAERAADSFFEDAHWEGVTRVCRGTSCQLAGAEGVIEGRATLGDCRPVHCLGYCDRSPVALLADGRVATGDRAARAEPELADAALPDVRWLTKEPVVTARVAMGCHSPITRALDAGVWSTLPQFLARGPEAILAELVRSGERGRGGAGFATAVKWRACAAAEGEEKFVVANGDEGDPGSFVDRVLMQHDPHAVLEGLALCAFAVGARSGIVYVRGEYPAAAAALERAIEEARDHELLGPAVCGTDFGFDVRVVRGRGSYVCGEETALLNCVEGRRGEVRLRPPYPVTRGLHGRPTVVNNVETLVNVPAILSRGAGAWRALGTRASPGTKALCLNAGFARPGILEVGFGTRLRDVLEDAGAEGIEAVLMGGPLGSVVFEEDWDLPLCYAELAERGIHLGHGGLVALPADTDWREFVIRALDFARRESCGRCAPCRLGTERAFQAMQEPGDPREELEAIFEAMRHTSLCAFGQLIPGPLESVIQRHETRIFGP